MIRAVIITGDRPGVPTRWGGTNVHDIIEQPNTPYGRRKLRRLVRESIAHMEDEVVSITFEDTEKPDVPGKEVTAEFVTIRPIRVAHIKGVGASCELRVCELLALVDGWAMVRYVNHGSADKPWVMLEREWQALRSPEHLLDDV